jgi:hypothetical protein
MTQYTVEQTQNQYTVTNNQSEYNVTVGISTVYSNTLVISGSLYTINEINCLSGTGNIDIEIEDYVFDTTTSTDGLVVFKKD